MAQKGLACMQYVLCRIEDDGHKLTKFGKGRIGYREWAHRWGYINSLDDKYEHDVDIALG